MYNFICANNKKIVKGSALLTNSLIIIANDKKRAII